MTKKFDFAVWNGEDFVRDPIWDRVYWWKMDVGRHYSCDMTILFSDYANKTVWKYFHNRVRFSLPEAILPELLLTEYDSDGKKILVTTIKLFDYDCDIGLSGDSDKLIKLTFKGTSRIIDAEGTWITLSATKVST